MKMGLFGLPLSGAGTVFQMLVGMKGGAGSGKMEGARTGVVKVPDARLDLLHEHFKAPKKVPIEVQIFDFERPPGSREGGKSANARILGLLRTVDVVALVARGFDDPAAPHPEGSVDPRRDLENLLLEMDFSDLELVERRLERIEESMRKGKKEEREALKREAVLLEEFKAEMEGGGGLRGREIAAADEKMIAGYGFLSRKPTIVVLNSGEDEFGGGGVELVSEAARGLPVVEVAGKLEAEISGLPEDDRAAFMEALGTDVPGHRRVMEEVGKALDNICFFTVGSDENRAWEVRRGANAVEAAGRVHSDMARGFIRAEVVAYEDFVRAGSMPAVKELGRFRLEGREYIVQDGDIVSFRFNV